MEMEGRYLLGATPAADTLAFLRRNTDLLLSPTALAERSAAAERARQGRPRPEDLPRPQPAPDAWRPHLDRVAARPLFQRLFGEAEWQFAAVPVASLIAVQPHVNWSYAQAQAARAAAEADLLQLCLPATAEDLELWGGVSPGEPPSASFYTRDPNVRVTEARMEASPRLTISFTISKTAVFLQVVRLAGRLYLKNGVHRAVGLAAAGWARLPCLLVEGRDVRDLPDLLSLPVMLRPDPPLVVDFLHPELFIAHPWQDRIKYIRLVPEEFVAPLPAPAPRL
jgi:hypothetical protein